MTPLRWLGPAFCLLFAAQAAQADKRVALVVGNSSYANIARLENPTNDARLMAETLRGLGFALVGGGAQIDVDKARFDGLVQNFGNDIQGADVALFYYAGHGVQVSGSNYLVPVNANPTREADVDFQMLDANLVLRQMQSAGTRLNVVLLDACRNNPFSVRGLRAAEGGLAQMRAPEGTLISYATQPGNVARDGADGNSPYTKALAQTLRKPGVGIFDAFNEVGLTVKRATGGAQQPWVSSSPIDGAFYFAGAPATPSATTAPPAAPAPPPQVAALPPPAAARTAPNGKQRFDGTWTTAMSCPEFKKGLAISFEFDAEVKDGVFHGVRGRPGQPGYVEFNGTIAPDGTVKLYARGLTGKSINNPRNAPPGTIMGYNVSGKVDGASGTGSRSEGRPCTLTFAKQGATGAR